MKERFIALAENRSYHRPTKKFAEVQFGPFEIVGRPNPNSVTLRLPRYLAGIHPVFPVSQVEPYIPVENIPHRIPEPPPPVEVEGELEFEVSEILDSKSDHCCRVPIRYYVRWAGYEGTDEEFSWVGADDLQHSLEFIQEFHERYLNKPGPWTPA